MPVPPASTPRPRRKPRRHPLKLTVTSNIGINPRRKPAPWELELLAPILREAIHEVIEEHKREAARNATSASAEPAPADTPIDAAIGRCTGSPMHSTEVRPPSRATPKGFEGAWHITEMEVWAADYIDLIVPGHITFNAESMGTFQFGAVRGWLDCRWVERDGKRGVEFSWEGEDDRDSKCGRGWAALESDGSLKGRFYIHRGDDSAFTATRIVEKRTRKDARRPK